MTNLDLHLVDFLLNKLTIYRHWRTLPSVKFKVWRERYEFELLFNGRPTTVHQISKELKIHLDKSSILSFEIYKGFEEDEIDFVKRFLKRGACFMDVGTNVGLFTLHASRSVGDSGKVISFEPSSETVVKLKKNLEVNAIKNVEVVQKGLSDQEGVLELTLANEGFDAFNSFATPTLGGAISSEQVEVTTVDNFLASKGLAPKDIDLMKVDVEGWELPIMKGGFKTFSDPQAPVLLVEFTEKNANNAGFTCVELSEYIASFGYELFIYDRKNRTLTKEPVGKTYDYQNLICVKPGTEMNSLTIL